MTGRTSVGLEERRESGVDQGGGGFTGNILNYEAAGEDGTWERETEKTPVLGEVSQAPMQRQAVLGRAPAGRSRLLCAQRLSGTDSRLLSWRPHHVALWSLSFP